MTISSTASCRSINRAEFDAVETVASPRQHPETLRVLTREIAFIHNPQFESADLDSVEERCEDAQLYRAMATNPDDIPDELPAYLGNLYSIPLLTAEGEQALFFKMNFLKYRANALRSSLDPQQACRPTIAEIHRLLDQADRVRNHIAECNLRLVVSIARRFADARLSFDELVSEGNMILMKAIEKFDHARGYRFSTYATHSVQRHFYRVFRKNRRRKLKEITITDQHLGELSDTAPTQLVAPETIDAHIGTLLAQIDQQLDEREQYIVRERFGIGPSGTPRTLQSLSHELAVSKERVRQLHHKAIAKLRTGLTCLLPDLLPL